VSACHVVVAQYTSPPHGCLHENVDEILVLQPGKEANCVTSHNNTFTTCSRLIPWGGPQKSFPYCYLLISFLCS